MLLDKESDARSSGLFSRRTRLKGKNTIFIVGAGFSHYAGLPLQGEFTRALLEAREFKRGPSSFIVRFLSEFIRRAFDHSPDAPPKNWPELEDIFTCVDLSANTGHYLGPNFSPQELRRIRGALISRILRMLRQRYEEAREKKNQDWKILEFFFKNVDPHQTAFISLNWDTVIEEGIAGVYGDVLVDYGCDAVRARFPAAENAVEIDEDAQGEPISIIKVHGSVNWLYCDNCRELYWFLPRESGKIADQLLRPADWKAIYGNSKPPKHKWTCNHCKNVALGARLATFSYLKAPEFPMFQKSWFSAERLLRDAEAWVFIGYSMPAADYEFKYLLKRVQLARRKPPRIVLITGGERPDAERTYENYQRFFGRIIRRDRNVFDNGLTEEVILHVPNKVR